MRSSSAEYTPRSWTPRHCRSRGRPDRPGATRGGASRPASDVLGFELQLPRFDLSLEKRRETKTPSSTRRRARSRPTDWGSRRQPSRRKGRDDVGSPNRILREEIGGKVIVRTGRRIPGVLPVGGVHSPISVVRMAVGDAYGAQEWREEGDAGGVPDRADRAADLPGSRRVRLPPGEQDRRQGLRRAKYTVSPIRGCSRRRWTPRPSDTRTSPTSRS